MDDPKQDDDDNGQGSSFGDDVPTGVLPSGKLAILANEDDPSPEEDDEYEENTE